MVGLDGGTDEKGCKRDDGKAEAPCKVLGCECLKSISRRDLIRHSLFHDIRWNSNLWLKRQGIFRRSQALSY